MHTRPFHLAKIALVVLLVALMPVRFAQAQSIPELYLFDDLFPIMASEGINSAGSEEATPLDPTELARWRAELARIYDADRMQAGFVAVIDEGLAGRDDIAQDAIDFAMSELGTRVLRLEISAREALLDDAVDEMARFALSEARAADPDTTLAKRLALVRERIAVNDLIELNVSLGMNTSFAYYAGMLSEADVPGMTMQDVLALVWAQEEDIRADVEDWIESYFLMAYQPLSDAELQQYILHSGSDLGDAFNRVMFRAFDSVFVDISKQVGAALGRAMSAQSL